MPAGPTVRRYAEVKVTSAARGHTTMVLVIASREQKARDIAWAEWNPCLPCRNAALRAEWAETVARHAENGLTWDANRMAWRHTCGYWARNEYSETCERCEPAAS